MNLFVWISVHLIKLVPFGQWALRPGNLPGGFPSGHATHAFVMAFALTSCFPRLWWLWNLIAAAISWSRVEVGDHTGFQVTVGVCFGILIAWTFTSRWIKLE
jgi:membrane-associated phospholipid phosphatase